MRYEYIPYHIPYQMSLKSSGKVDQELPWGYMNIFITKCLLKAKSRPEAASMRYEYIPYQISLKSLRQVLSRPGEDI